MRLTEEQLKCVIADRWRNTWRDVCHNCICINLCGSLTPILHPILIKQLLKERTTSSNQVRRNED